jgi:TolB-like protein/class 3 adenylate cyclase
MSQTRQLAAIMFTDIVGYTALMGKDEQKAFELLRKNREIHKPLIKQFHGTWIKELGDGVMASFHTVTDAVFCAAAIHQACSKIEGLQLRIGIHLGEVIFENNDVFGDGVNIASRLQSMAAPGSTWVSEAVYKNLANKKEIISEFVKEEHLKNVSEPVKVYEISVKEIPLYIQDNTKALKKPNDKREFARKKAIYLGGVVILSGLIAAWFLFFNNQTTSASAKDSNTEKSIAVLYFDNMSGDPDQEYFSDGITEEIITHISKIEGIRTISRTSVLPYKGKPVNLKKIADELHVNTILEGSVRKSGNTLRITAQLIDAHTDQHLWAETFDKEMKDIFEVQSDIARTIAKKFEIEISPNAKSKIGHIPTTSVEAYDQFQKGKYFMYTKYNNNFNEEDFEKARNYFEQAIRLDSAYAEPYSGLAELYDVRRNIQGDKFPQELELLKQRMARKGYQLNPKSSFANLAMAYALLHRTNPDIDSGFFYLKKAYYLDPENPENSYNLGADLSFSLGLHSTAVPIMLKAIKTDPLDPNQYAILGYQYLLLGRNEEAKKAFLTSYELTNDQFQFEGGVLFYLIYLGDFINAEKRLKLREGSYSKERSFLFAVKGEPNKIELKYLNDEDIRLAMNREKILKDVIKRRELQVDKGNNNFKNDYHWLLNSWFFDAYKNDTDFKRVLAKAKKNYEINLLKYGKIEMPE